MSEKRQEAAFLEAICATPDDDGPRLMYADWLEERGDPASQARAEFIRVQCELAQMDQDDERFPALKERERKLRVKHGKRWAGKFGRYRGHGFRRGFIDKVRLRPTDFFACADWMFAEAPVTTLLLEHWNAAQIRRLAASPHFARVRGLGMLYCTMKHAGMRGIAESPHARNLAELEMTGGGVRIGNEGLAILANAPAMANLTHLVMEGNGIGTVGVEALANSPYLRRLVSLSLGGNRVGGAGVRALSASPVTATLKTLSLLHTRLQTADVEELVTQPLFARLKRLNLAANGLYTRAAQALANSPALKGLRGLWVGFNPLGDRGVAALLDSPYRDPRMELNLCRCGRVSDVTQKMIARRLGRKAIDYEWDWANDRLSRR
jgi:uncharacterized protein (TIGR02996 family)